MRVISVHMMIGAVAALALASGCSRHNAVTWTTDSGVRIEELAAGDGDMPRTGDIVGIVYTASYVDGAQFDRYEDRESPYRFRLGMDQVLPGLDEGVRTMRVGGKRILEIPPDLAFEGGERPSTVPPDAWVRMDVELVDIIPSPPAPEPWNDAGREIQVTESGLQYVDFKVGDGDVPRMSNTVIVHYSGFLDDGTLFDTSFFTGVPLAFKLDSKTLIPGFVEGLLTMRVGGQRELIIPPHLAYGEKGFRKRIPPQATLTYNVQLIEIREH